MDFCFIDDNFVVVIEICKWLDGLLLVIELVVVWLWLMMFDEIIDGLCDWFVLLIGGVCMVVYW